MGVAHAARNSRGTTGGGTSGRRRIELRLVSSANATSATRGERRFIFPKLTSVHHTGLEKHAGSVCSAACVFLSPHLGEPFPTYGRLSRPSPSTVSPVIGNSRVHA